MLPAPAVLINARTLAPDPIPLSSLISTRGGYWYPNPPCTTSTDINDPSLPTIGLAWTPTPPPPKKLTLVESLSNFTPLLNVINWLLPPISGGGSPNVSSILWFVSPSPFNPTIPPQAPPSPAFLTGNISEGCNLLTWLIFKYWTFSLFLKMKIVPGFNFAYWFASWIPTRSTNPLSVDI